MAAVSRSSGPVVVLTGPTGAGKSAWALQLAAEFPVEIISVDSALVYRGMDIGTAKPTAIQRAQAPHHLIDIRDPAESYSAGEFVRDARALIAEIQGRGRLPLLVGGTMLYLRSLLQGIAVLPQGSAEVRASLDARAVAVGWPGLHRELAAVDAVAAARIHPNDSQRIQRALEVFQLTGRPLTHWQSTTRGVADTFQWLRLGLIPTDRKLLQSTLMQRFRLMLQQGLAEEVQALYARGDLHQALPAIRAVGYRQLWEWCAGRQSLETATTHAVTATCQLAKRQLTWLRADQTLIRIDPADSASWQQVSELLRKSVELL